MILDAEDPGRGRSHPIEIVAAGACRQEALGRSEGMASEAERRRQTRSAASLVDRRGVGLMADGRSPPDGLEVVLATDEAADPTMGMRRTAYCAPCWQRSSNVPVACRALRPAVRECSTRAHRQECVCVCARARVRAYVSLYELACVRLRTTCARKSLE